MYQYAIFPNDSFCLFYITSPFPHFILKMPIWNIFPFALLLIIGSSISPGIHKEDHKTVTPQCCLAKSGKVCGTLIKDCCKSQCEKGVLSSQWCKDNEQLTPICETCTSVCKKKGGSPCQVSVDTGRISCCASQNCIKEKNNSTSSGLGDKILNIATSKLIGAALAQHQLADQIIEKFIGPGGHCKDGTEIDLGDCISDSFVDLVETKVIG